MIKELNVNDKVRGDKGYNVGDIGEILTFLVLSYWDDE